MLTFLASFSLDFILDFVYNNMDFIYEFYFRILYMDFIYEFYIWVLNMAFIYAFYISTSSLKPDFFYIQQYFLLSWYPPICGCFSQFSTPCNPDRNHLQLLPQINEV